MKAKFALLHIRDVILPPLRLQDKLAFRCEEGRYSYRSEEREDKLQSLLEGRDRRDEETSRQFERNLRRRDKRLGYEESKPFRFWAPIRWGLIGGYGYLLFMHANLISQMFPSAALTDDLLRLGFAAVIAFSARHDIKMIRDLGRNYSNV